MLTFQKYITEDFFDNFLDEMTDEEIHEFIEVGLIEDDHEDHEDDEDDDDKEVDEDERVMKISGKEKRERSKAYRKDRSKIKLKSAKYRKSSKYKKYAKKKKKMAVRGRTASGQKIRKKKVIG